jgi:hypothetical protein
MERTPLVFSKDWDGRFSFKVRISKRAFKELDQGFSKKKLTDIGLLVLVFRILGLIHFFGRFGFLDISSGFSFSGYRTIDLISINFCYKCTSDG